MKKLGLGLLGLVVVLIAAVLVVPSLVDWNAQKGRLTDEVLALTGRALVVEGDVSLALLPAPALSAARVRLANIEGGSAAAMLELESLKVRVALMPLIRGEIQVESIDLVAPQILLEVLPDGRRNWAFGTAGESGTSGATVAPESGTAGGGVLGGIRFDRVTVTDGRLVYRDTTSGLEERIEDLNAEFGADSLKGPFAAGGQARIREIPTDFEINLGKLVDGGATPLSFVLGVPDAAASSQFAGALSLHEDGASLRGRVKARGETLAGLVAALPSEAALPEVFAKPFSLETDLALDTRQIAIRELMLQLADTKAEGEIEVTLEPQLDAQVRLSASRVDLDALLAPAEGAAPSEGSAAAPAEDASTPAAQADPAAAGFSLPKDMTGALDLSVDAVVFRGQVVRQLLVSLGLEDGRLKIGQALALLPGGSDVSLSGAVVPETPETQGAPAGLRFDGRLEAASDNLRGIFDWLGVGVAQVPASRLRKMSLNTDISATPSSVMLSRVDLRVDLSRVTGGVAVAVRERLGIGVGLALDKIDLDAYLPAGPQGGWPSGPAPESGAPTGSETGSETGESQTTARVPAAPRFAAPPVLDAFDANFDVRVGQMTVQGIPLTGLHLDATLQQGSLALRELVLGEQSGAKARVVGTFAKLTEAPAADAAYDLSIPDPARLAKLMGLEPGLLGQVGRVQLSGTFKGDRDALDLKADLEALDGRFGAEGRLQPMTSPLAFDLAVTGTHPDLARLAAVLAPETNLAPGLAPDLAPDLGGLEFAATLAGTPRALAIRDLSATLGPLELEGRLNADLSQPEPAFEGIDLAVAARHPDLAALIDGFAPEAGLASGLAPGLGLALEARVQGTGKSLKASGISGKLGPTEVNGTLALDLRGERPLVTAELGTGALPFDAFAAPAAAGGEAGGGEAQSGQAGAGSGEGAASRAAARWSRAPIDLSALGLVDADLSLRSAALVQGKTRLANAVAEARLRAGVLDIRKFSGTLHDGAVLVTGKLDSADGLEASLGLNAIEINSAKLLAEVPQGERVSGPINLEASITAKGGNQAELVTSLAGVGALSGTLNVAAKAEEQVGALVLGILGQKIREIRGITDATSVVFNAFAGTPARVQGTFAIEGGVLETSDLQVQGRDATALTQGTADLPLWTLDTQTDVLREQTGDEPYLTVSLTGPLDAPNVKLSGQPLQRRPEPAPAESGTATTPSTPAAPAQPAQPQDFKPEDILKEGLKGLLKGLQN